MDNSGRIAQIKARIDEHFSPQQFDLVDDSHLHAGHASAKGGGHFSVTIVSEAFEGKATVQRHRMVYAAMGEMMQHEIHALSIKAQTPTEFNANK